MSDSYTNQAGSHALGFRKSLNLTTRYLHTAVKIEWLFFFEYVKDQDRYVHAILSVAKPMNPLTAEQKIAPARATTCAQCNEQFTKKKDKSPLSPERPMYWSILQHLQF